MACFQIFRVLDSSSQQITDLFKDASFTQDGLWKEGELTTFPPSLPEEGEVVLDDRNHGQVKGTNQKAGK